MTKVQKKQMQRRAEIIEAVIPMLNTVSFEELSISDICAAADISTGSFYHYFDKKSDILVGLLGLIDDDMEKMFPGLNSDDERDNLLNFAGAWASHVEAHGLARSKLISSTMPSDINHSGKTRSSKLKLEEIMARGQDKGQITAEYRAEELAEMFMMALRAVTVDWSRCDGAYPITDKMDGFIRFFIRGLRA